MATTIGIDLGGTKVLAVRVVDGEVAAQSKFSTPGGVEEIGFVAAEAAKEVWDDDVIAVGAGIAGLVRWPDGVFVWGPHVAGTHVSVREQIEQALGVPAVVDNDANTAAWGELHLGVAQGYQDVLLVTLGTGIGGAVIVDGAIHRGGSFAGEWGHMRYQRDGPRCDCGKSGCWETFASGPALVRLARSYLAQNPEGALARRFDQNDISAEAVTAAADGGDEAARSLVAQVGADLGQGLSNLIAVFDPELIVVGGGLGSVGESLLGPARRVVIDALHGGAHRMAPPILVAGLGPAAGAVGAALLAADVSNGKVALV